MLISKWSGRLVVVLIAALALAGFVRAQQPEVKPPAAEKPADPKPADPAKPAEPKPADPTKLADPAKPVVPGDPPKTAILPGKPQLSLVVAASEIKVLRVTHLKAKEAESLFALVLGSNSSVATLASSAYASSGAATGPPPALAGDDKAKLVFVRGSAEQATDAEAVLAAFDRPRTAWQSAEVSGTLILPVQHTTVARIGQILNQLRLPASTLALGKGGLIVVRGGGPEVNAQVSEVVKALDVPDDLKPPAPKAMPPGDMPPPLPLPNPPQLPEIPLPPAK